MAANRHSISIESERWTFCIFRLGIEKFKTNNQNLVLDGLTIKSVRHQIEAKATLLFKNGLIDNLEIWCYEGEYPQKI